MLHRELEPAPYGFGVLPTAEAVSEARRHIADRVRGWRLGLTDEAIGNLELLSSEVIANAIAHTGAACAVRVRWTGARVRVEVTDADPDMPRVGQAALYDESGRGLLLVDALSEAWGTDPDPAGKVVWFEIEPGTALVGLRRLALVRAVAFQVRACQFPMPSSRGKGQRWPHQVGLATVVSWQRSAGRWRRRRPQFVDLCPSESEGVP